MVAAEKRQTGLQKSCKRKNKGSEKNTVMQLLPFQNEARILTNRLLNAHRHPLFVSPTGTGKTITAIAIIADRIKLNQRIFVLTPQDEIFQQWLVQLSRYGIDYGYINQDGVTGRNKMVYICMPMSLNNILSKLPERFKPDVIVTDECHHSRAETWDNIHTYYNNALRMGLTATPKRLDGKSFENIYTDIVQTITMQEAIDAGYLAKPLLVVPEMYKLNVRMQNGDYDVEEQAQQLGKPKIVGNILENYKTIFCGAPTIVACSTFDHAQHMTQQFNNAGWRFEHIHSKLPYSDRKRIIRLIRQKKINGICTVGIGVEGMDIPGLYGLIFLRRTMSLTIYLQFIGRVLRPDKNKKYGIIIDSVGNSFIHGRPEIDRKWSLGNKKDDDNDEMASPTMKLCPICSVMNAQTNKYCHICGYDFFDEIMQTQKKRKLPAVVDGELVLLDDDVLDMRNKKHNIEMIEEHNTHNIALTKKDKMEILKNGLEYHNNFFDKAKKDRKSVV